MLFDVRRLMAARLDAFHETVDVRLRHLRIGLHRGRNVTTDFTLLERAVPFVHRVQRATLTLVLAGVGRFDELGKSGLLQEGEMVLSDARLLGTEAYTGEHTSRLVLEWDPAQLGAAILGTFAIERLRPRDTARLREAAGRLGSPLRERAITDVLAILRGLGLPFAHLEAERPDPSYAALNRALAARLDRLEGHPDVEELADELGWNRRLGNRRVRAMAQTYALVRPHWREALHASRLLAAMRLLSAPGATTEIVARLTGFRAPAALCRAFADVGWPSPGVFTRASRRDPITSWAALSSSA